VFGGKAAPGYQIAKLMIRLVTGIASIVNSDPVVAGRIKVVFYPDFTVKQAQFIYPAADLSEQISMAGKEASGTGNMKFMLNGAVTIGTLDGANVEIRDAVGPDNFFLFGLTAPEIAELQRSNRVGYRPAECVGRSPWLSGALELIRSGLFSGGDRETFGPLLENLLEWDPFFVLADFAAYAACQEQVNEAWSDTERWTRMSIANTAHAGRFSSDRAVREYASRIWGMKPVAVPLE
jgi:starch phosphorylase